MRSHFECMYMKQIFITVITTLIICKVAFAQTDTLFKSETAPANFSKLSFEEIKIQYTWNDTSVRIIDYFRKENSSSHINLGASIGLLVIGPALIWISFEKYNDHLLIDANYILLNLVGFSLGVTGVIGLPVSLIEAKIYNKSNLYKVLRTYRLKGEVNKKYLRN